jgi:serine/threonine-protein phosphatase CPPED1
MKRLLGLGAAGAFLVAVAAVSMSQDPKPTPPAPGDFRVEVEEKNPWTHLRPNHDPNDFRFAIVSDRTGGHRPQVFSKAVERLNSLQPEFVVSVGDLIEGYTEEQDKIDAQWKEFEGFVKKLQMPFWYCPGNHDVSNPVMVKDWNARFGRHHYSFVYRNVLFLVLNSEDPKVKNGNKITEDQIAAARKVLEAHRGARWTFVFLHKPLWIERDAEKSGWPEVEKLLAGRSYTVFAGHVHRYQKFVRQGQNYYMLATTGGSSKMRGLRYGEFDHLTWVTMKKEPVVANLLLDGIFNDAMQVSDTDEPGVSTKNRKVVHPCRATVTLEGKPVPNAAILLYSYSETTKKYSRVADGVTESDGGIALSTYQAFDGVPAGEYTVTVTSQVPRWDQTGAPTPNRLPEPYAEPEKSPLKARVVAGVKNELKFELKR